MKHFLSSSFYLFQNTKIASLEEENVRLKEMVCKFREAFFEIK